MCEKLFRGKRTDNGEWVCGDLLQDVESGICAIVSYVNLGGNIHDLSESCIFAVIPETVGQYTGLTDKNNVKIFEGDIVTGYFNYEKIIGYIFYGGNAHFFIQRDGILGIGLDNADCWLEVISNVHDNPKLLGGDSNDQM